MGLCKSLFINLIYMTETIKDPPTITNVGVIQTIRNYNYDINQVVIERQVNGKTVSQETFYLD